MREHARPRLRTRSPVEGLEWRRLGPVEVFAQSVSGTAPSAAMAATPAIVAAAAGGATVWSFVVATVVALLIATCISQFTRRMAVTGGLYTLTAKGLIPQGVSIMREMCEVAGTIDWAELRDTPRGRDRKSVV